MNDLIKALDFYVMVMISYERNYLTAWGPGYATTKAKDNATEMLEKALAAYVDQQVEHHLLNRVEE